MQAPDMPTLLEDAADRIADISRTDLQIMLRRTALLARNSGSMGILHLLVMWVSPIPIVSIQLYLHSRNFIHGKRVLLFWVSCTFKNLLSAFWRCLCN
ncbi:hypothetical protein ACVIEM_002974 [Rhizobium leguminosarum]